MIEHKKRVIFYPMQLRDFVRDHGAELPIGIPVAYDTIKPERYCIVRPNRFRFYHELCGANGLPLNFFTVLMLQAFRKKDLYKSSLGSRTNKFVTQSKGSHYKKITTIFPFCLSRNYMFVAIFTGFVTVASR